MPRLGLRPYQASLYDDILKATATAKRVVAVLPTGGGKTVIQRALVDHYVGLGRRVTILTHRDSILRQQSRAVSHHRHGIISPSHDETDDHVQVASVLTLARRLDRHKTDVLIVDECHHALAKSWRRVIETLDVLTIGFTATPIRLDGQGLGSLFQTIVTGATIRDLIRDNYLVEPIIYAPSVFDATGIKTTAGDYNFKSMVKQLKRQKIIGGAVNHYRRFADGRSCLVYCATVDHARETADRFNAESIAAEVLSADVSVETRARVIERLTQRVTRVIVSVDTISEGTDVPSVSAIIILRPTKSLSLFMQQVGRGLRPDRDKRDCVVIDAVGNCMIHGSPDDAREWSLDGVSKTSRGPNNAGAYVICKECLRIYDKKHDACPYCGIPRETTGREPDEVDGELVEFLSFTKKMELIKSANSLSDLHKIAKKLNYKSGWVYYEAKKRGFHI